MMVDQSRNLIDWQIGWSRNGETIWNTIMDCKRDHQYMEQGKTQNKGIKGPRAATLENQ